MINPDLPLATENGRIVDPGTGPALAYHLLAPQTRTAYLNWLSGGRRADVSPGLVLLFCFGLERRVLVDTDHHPTAVHRELPAILAEVHRLRVRYGDGGPALRGALDNLLDLLELLAAARIDPGLAHASRPGSRPLATVRDSEPSRATTMAVRVALARFATASAPVPADWARAWVRHHPSLATRSAEMSCPAEFDRLFALRYRDRHGPGLVPPADVPGIRLRYQPASSGLTTILVCRADLPDVLAEPRSTRALGALLDGVASALDPYRRWLARFPQGRSSLASATLLPPELVDAGHGQLGALRVWAERQLDGRSRALIDAAEFWSFWSTATPERMARDEAAALLTVLGLLEFGVEPDVRFGAPALAPGPAVLFRLGRPASDRPSPRFPAAAVVARCAAAVALAAGPVDPQRGVGVAVLATISELAATLPLGPGEDLRLAARLSWLLTTGVDVDRLGRQTAALPAAERETTGHYLIRVAVAADPGVGPATVAVLIRVYRILGLEPDLVFHRLHERSVGDAPAFAGPVPLSGDHLRPATRPWSAPPRPAGADGLDEPVVVQASEVLPSGYALPWTTTTTPPAATMSGRAPPGEVLLDRARVMRKIAESSTAATILTAIFDADPDHASGAVPFAPGQPPGGEASSTRAEHVAFSGDTAATHAGDGTDRVAGLDLAHSALLRALATRPCWTREEFASLAVAHRVLPDGAVDVLNEVAIETVGAPVIEGEATLAVDYDVLLELLP